MAKELKPSANKAGGKGMNPLLAGILIGLLLGILLAVGVAVWLKASNPFVKRSEPVEALPPLANRPAAESPPGKPEPAAATKGEGDKRFTFYDVLPGDGQKDGTARKPSTDVGGKAAEATNVPPPNKESTPAVTPPSQKDGLILQAGAFQSETDAENLKAKIAFTGLEAHVKKVTLSDKGTLYRVRLGPFKNSDEVAQAKVTLAQSGINASVIKTDN